MHFSWRTAATLVLVVVAGVACGDESGLAEQSPDETTAVEVTAVSSTLISSGSSVVQTTEPATLSTTTTEPPPAPDPTLRYPAQDPVDTNNPVGVNRAGGFAVGVIEETGELVAIDLETGAVERTLAAIDLEARWISRLQLNWDGSAVYYQAQSEDYWFSCESSPGTIIRLDFETGTETQIGLGAEPQISPDGSHLAYLSASQCLPDQTDPANFVVTPYNSVVVRELATGEERTWVDQDLAASLATGEGDVIEAQHEDIAWVGPDVIAVNAGRIRIDTMEMTGQGVGIRAEAGGSHTVVGLHVATDQFILEQELWNEQGQRIAGLVGMNAATGETTVYGETKSASSAFAFDSANSNLIGLDDGHLIFDGRSVPLAVEISNLDW